MPTPTSGLARSLESLLRTRGVTPEAPDLVQAAIDGTRGSRRGGFVDHLIAEVGMANGCHAALTFDTLFSKNPGVRRLL